MVDASPEAMDVWRKKELALSMRLHKASYRSIAEACGISPQTALAWVKEMTAHSLPQDDLEALRAQEVAGLDENEANARTAINMLMRAAARKEDRNEPISSELEQIGKWQEQIANIKKQRAQLLGLNIVPIVKHQISVKTEFDAEVEELVAHLTGGGDLLTGPADIDVGEDVNT